MSAMPLNHVFIEIYHAVWVPYIYRIAKLVFKKGIIFHATVLVIGLPSADSQA